MRSLILMYLVGTVAMSDEKNVCDEWDTDYDSKELCLLYNPPNMPTPDFIPNGDFDCDKDYTLYYESIEDCEHFWKYHARTNLSPEVVKDTNSESTDEGKLEKNGTSIQDESWPCSDFDTDYDSFKDCVLLNPRETEIVTQMTSTVEPEGQFKIVTVASISAVVGFIIGACLLGALIVWKFTWKKSSGPAKTPRKRVNAIKKIRETTFTGPGLFGTSKRPKKEPPAIPKLPNTERPNSVIIEAEVHPKETSDLDESGIKSDTTMIPNPGYEANSISSIEFVDETENPEVDTPELELEAPKADEISNEQNEPSTAKVLGPVDSSLNGSEASGMNHQNSDHETETEADIDSDSSAKEPLLGEIRRSKRLGDKPRQNYAQLPSSTDEDL